MLIIAQNAMFFDNYLSYILTVMPYEKNHVI